MSREAGNGPNLIHASIRHYLRTHQATVLALSIVTATLTGALLVGHSLRQSLLSSAMDRIGPIEYVIRANRFFPEDLAHRVNSCSAGMDVVPLLMLAGGASAANTGARVNRINIYGVDALFHGLSANAAQNLSKRQIILNENLAVELGTKVGDDVVLRLTRPTVISPETLMGKRDDSFVTARLTISEILSEADSTNLSLQANEYHPRNAFVSLSLLQSLIDTEGRLNTILINRSVGSSDAMHSRQQIVECIQSSVSLRDLGLDLKDMVDKAEGSPKKQDVAAEAAGSLSFQSDSFLLEPAYETAARETAKSLGAPSTAVLAYLANSITVSRPEPAKSANTDIPYSIVVAIDESVLGASRLRLTDGARTPTLLSGDIALNTWAADDLQAQVGDRICIDYFITASFGQLETRSSCFTLRGIVEMDEASTDVSWVPEYPGVTDVKHLSDWDPPFPIELRRIRPKDEDYWDQFRTAPKAFISLEDGRRLWAEHGERFGRLTSFRFGPLSEKPLAEHKDAISKTLLSRIDLEKSGISIEPLRERALAASRGTTDFGVLFASFSAFLIASALMLAALLFRLHVERRTRQIGLLLAIGFTRRRVIQLLLVEGAILAGIGGALGLVGAILYCRLMINGLQSWWSEALRAPFLTLHVSPSILVMGFFISSLTALFGIAWVLRGITALSARDLLGGAAAAKSSYTVSRSKRLPRAIAWLSLAIAAALIALAFMSDIIPPVAAFFTAGSAVLTACLLHLRIWLRHVRLESALDGISTGAAALWRLGWGNARRNPGRSLLTASLIASATFVIVAVGAFRLDTEISADRYSGTGGFARLAESTVPVLYDLNSKDGREALGLSEDANRVLERATVIPFRLRSGDDTSCRGLYQPKVPRILGATSAMIERGGFVFADSLADTTKVAGHSQFEPQAQASDANPWLLLNQPLADGAIPVIGDESAVKWQLHLGLGQDLVIQDYRGNERRLRFVGLLRQSVLQSEIIMSEASFIDLFPDLSGYAFFLIDTPAPSADEVQNVLERELSGFAFDVKSTENRLRDFLEVQNTYISMFQSLGGLGLLLGVLGLSAILVRQVWERRSELALMSAIGFRRSRVKLVVLAETVGLLGAGLIIGVGSALLAIGPQIASHNTEIPWLSLTTMLTIVLVVGTGSAIGALTLALRAPLISALRRE